MVEVVVEGSLTLKGLPADFELPTGKKMKEMKEDLIYGIAAANEGVEEDMIEIIKVAVEEGRRLEGGGAGELVVEFSITETVKMGKEDAIVQLRRESLESSAEDGTMGEEIQDAANKKERANYLGSDLVVGGVTAERGEEEESYWARAARLTYLEIGLITGAMFALGLAGVVLSCVLWCGEGAGEGQGRVGALKGLAGETKGRGASGQVNFGDTYGGEKGGDML